MNRCRFCAEEITLIEPVDACGWGHVDLSDPRTLRFWCGWDDTGEMRRVEPRMKARAGKDVI